MIVNENIALELFEKDVTLICKNESRVMRFIAWFLSSSVFLNTWTTIGSTIYYSSGVIDPYEYSMIIKRELEFTSRMSRLGFVWWVISYLFLPLPFFLAYFRWREERKRVRFWLGGFELVDAERVRLFAEAIWERCGKCWPKSWMERWLLEELSGKH